MPEYIDREKYCAEVCRCNKEKCDKSKCPVWNAPAADVAPVVHGKWKLCYEDYRRQIEGDECTACGFQHYGTAINHYRYCPACGAKMDLEADKQWPTKN